MSSHFNFRFSILEIFYWLLQISIWGYIFWPLEFVGNPHTLENLSFFKLSVFIFIAFQRSSRFYNQTAAFSCLSALNKPESVIEAEPAFPKVAVSKLSLSECNWYRRVERLQFRSHSAWLGILILSVTTCVTLHQVLNFSVPISSTKMGTTYYLPCRVAMKSKWINTC